MNTKRQRIKDKQLNREEKLRQIKEEIKLLKKAEINEENVEIVTCIRGLMDKSDDIDIVLEEVRRHLKKDDAKSIMKETPLAKNSLVKEDENNEDEDI